MRSKLIQYIKNYLKKVWYEEMQLREENVVMDGLNEWTDLQTLRSSLQVNSVSNRKQRKFPLYFDYVQ